MNTRNRSSLSPVSPARRHRRALLGVGSLSGWLLLAAGACSDDGSSSGCTPGATSACPGPGLCDGIQLCNAEGTAFGNCECDADLPGGSGAGGSSNAGSSNAGSSNAGAAGSAMSMAGANAGGSAGTGPDLTRQVGAPCAVDADCGGPLICSPPNVDGIFGAGGPPGGYCTMPCRSSNQCIAVDILGACALLDANGDGFCVARCEPGDSIIKCRGAEGERTQACLPTNNDGNGVCIPRCHSDADCVDGRFCDLGDTGLCDAAASDAGDIGAACTQDTQETDCASRDCFVTQGGGAFCTAYCTFGYVSGCGFERDETPREAACLNTVSPTGDVGDLGECFELCDVATDCEQDGFDCQPLSPANEMSLGRGGFCVPPA